MWLKFQTAWGKQKIKDAYAWDEVPRVPRPLETVYVAEPDIAWGSLTKHPLGDAYWLSIGVFPEHANKGVRKLMREFLLAEAFGRRYADYVMVHILDSNPRYQNHMLEHTTPGFKLSGHLKYPIGYVEFVITQEDYDATRALALCR